MSGSFAMFDWLLLAISVYVLYSGIVGKGKLYSVENIKEDKQEEFKAFSRKIYIFLGITMIINSGASLLSSYLYPVAATAQEASATEPIIDLGAFSFLTPSVFRIITVVALVVTLGLIVFLIVKMRKYIDKNTQAKKSDAAKPGGGSSMPSSAFNFDDDEKSDK